jgi:D-xylulose reductase
MHTPARALVLEHQGKLSLRDIPLPMGLGPGDARIRIHTVGICGSDIHYYQHGRIGNFVVDAPMVLGHEGAGTVVEVGSAVKDLKPGDRVCMEPGIPNPMSRAAKLGLYNVDPAVTFWATPPIHGILTREVVHPASFSYRLPNNVTFAEGAMVEPFAVGMHAAARARIAPGDTAVVIGAGTIGIMVALAALAGGCARAFVADLSAEKLAIAETYPGIEPVNVADEDLAATVLSATSGWGADVVFEASGSPRVWDGMLKAARPGGAIVLVGLPSHPVLLDVNAAIAKELRIETVFRYANVFDRALALITAGKVDLKPLVSRTYAFAESVAAFERAAKAFPGDVKIQIIMDEAA